MLTQASKFTKQRRTQLAFYGPEKTEQVMKTLEGNLRQ